jgi:hypothetical protein
MFGKTHTRETKEFLRKCLIMKNRKEFICEHCNRTIMGIANFKRYHSDNCKHKPYKLFLDDERFPKLSNDWVIVRNIKEFKKTIRDRGLPFEISFDHDLNQENGKSLPTGYDCLKWMVYDMRYDLRKVDVNVHSANPVGRDNIEGLLKSWNKFLDSEDGEGKP